jgi:hypothetical protein
MTLPAIHRLWLQVDRYSVKSGNDLAFWEQKGRMRAQDSYVGARGSLYSRGR